MASRVLDATLVAIAEHGLVPSVQASRMTLAAAPDAIQGAVAAGILGCGSVILGSSEAAGRLFLRVDALAATSRSRSRTPPARSCARCARPSRRFPATATRCTRRAIRAWRGCSRWRSRRPRRGTSLPLPRRWRRCCPGITGRDLRLNVSAAIPAVMLDVGFPAEALKGVPILARCAGLIGHLTEELSHPIGFALSYQASREQRYTGALPAGVTLKTMHTE